MAFNAAPNANAVVNNLWGVTNQSVDPDFDRWLVREHHRLVTSDINNEPMQSYIRNLEKNNIELPPIYSSFKQFRKYMHRVSVLESRVQILIRMYECLNRMCPDLPRTQMDCMRDLQEATGTILVGLDVAFGNSGLREGINVDKLITVDT
ncbi:hypothetical protein CHU98_g12201 [Xylaria longipes]|nr:hypothetical protein CHU98_g12201 [Xylaria longipes]